MYSNIRSFFQCDLCMQVNVRASNNYRIRYGFQKSCRLKALSALLTLSTYGCLFLWRSLIAVGSPSVRANCCVLPAAVLAMMQYEGFDGCQRKLQH